ncbi:MAG: hypothetical protein ACKOW8_00140 [Flavobacteriales bacterium]
MSAIIGVLQVVLCKRIMLMMPLIFAGFGRIAAQSEHILQVSGIAVAGDSLIPVPFASIYRSSDYRGTFSDYQGYFTMPAIAGDTLHFVFLGLKKSVFLVPYDTTQQHISIVQWMEQDTLTLPTVNVLPYPSRYRLRAEILALDLPGDRYYKFSRDVVSIAQLDGLRDLSADAFNEQDERNNMRQTSGFKSGGNLLDAAAWSTFVRSIRRKR